MTTELRALITGANRGIGFELARQLSAKGWKVYVAARSLSKAEEACRALGDKAVALELDVSNAPSIAAAAKAYAAKESGLELLVNNAGIVVDRDNALKVTADSVRATFETNTIGPMLVTQAFAEMLKTAKNAHVINVSSGMGQLAEMGTGSAAYRLSKAALNALTKILAHDLGKDGIRVNAICPGWVKTDMGTAFADLAVEDSVSQLLPLILKTETGTGGFYRHSKIIPW